MELTQKSFGEVLEALKDNKSAKRAVWTSEFIYLVGESLVYPNQLRGNCLTHCSELGTNLSGQIKINPHIDQAKTHGIINCGWSPTPEDTLATDWIILD